MAIFILLSLFNLQRNVLATLKARLRDVAGNEFVARPTAARPAAATTNGGKLPAAARHY